MQLVLDLNQGNLKSEKTITNGAGASTIILEVPTGPAHHCEREAVFVEGGDA
jgi:hypothetical protein